MKKVAFVPTSKYYENNRLFSAEYNRNGLLDPYNYLLDKFSKEYIFYTIDQVKDINTLDVVIFERIDFKYLFKLLITNKNCVKILIPWEPEVVVRFHSINFLKKVSSYFDYVLTWNDDLVDNKKFFKFHFPVNLENNIKDIPTESSFNQKRLITQISSNLVSKHPLELYSYRKNLILQLSSLIPNEFDFYGHGWGDLNLPNYKGVAIDKFVTLSNYKYSLCLENMKDTRGYITEKIFDCFKSSVVPIYLGASNIESYILRDTYIKIDPNTSIEKLIFTLDEINYTSWKNYIQKAKTFLTSDNTNKFSTQSYAKLLVDFFNRSKNNSSQLDIELVYLAICHSIKSTSVKILKKMRFLK
jgi:alpha(1,3/1,4) fucosyltransferase